MITDFPDPAQTTGKSRRTIAQKVADHVSTQGHSLNLAVYSLDAEQGFHAVASLVNREKGLLRPMFADAVAALIIGVRGF